MNILVTGGLGYIGSHTCVELLSHNYKVIIVDNLSNSKLEVLNRISEITNDNLKFYNVDLLNKKMLEEVFINNKIDAVIHFAGLKAVGESVAIPIKYYSNNISGTLVLLELMERYKVRRLVFSSSATVYGMDNSMPVSEDSPLAATNPYGRTKQMIEEILQDLYLSNKNWSISLLRYFNPIGAHPSGLIGEDPNGVPNNLMPNLTQIAIGKLRELRIFGNDYPTKDGTGIRDYIHVIDLAQGHIKALNKDMAVSGVTAFNLGTGAGYSVLEVIKAFEKVSGHSIPYTFVDRRPGDAAVCYADATKARVEINWTAKKGIEDMCRDAWKWQLTNPDGYNSPVVPVKVNSF